MEGGLPSVRTILGMIEAGLTIALVGPVFQQIPMPGVVFGHLAGRGVFTEMGVVYRRDDSSPILASFLNELRRTRQSRAGSAEAALRPREKKAPGRRAAAQGAKG